MIGSLLYLFWQREAFFERAKDGLTTTLGKRFGLHLVARKVHGSLLDNIVLRQVWITDPSRPHDSITIDRVSLKYSLFKIVTRREKMEGIQGIEILRPSLRLRRSRAKVSTLAWASLTREAAKDFPPTTIRNGRLEIIDQEGRRVLLLEGIDASLRRDLFLLRVREGRIELEEPLWVENLSLSMKRGRIDIKSLMVRYRGMEFSLQGRVPSLEARRIELQVVANLLSAAPLYNLFGIEELNGLDLSGQMKIKGTLYYPDGKPPSFEGEVVIKPKEGGSPSFARISWREETLRLSSILVEEGPHLPYRIQGNIDVEDSKVNGDLVILPSRDDHPVREMRVLFSKRGEEISIERLRIHGKNGEEAILKGEAVRPKRREGHALSLSGSIILPSKGHLISAGIGFKGKIEGSHLYGALKITDLSIDNEVIGSSLHRIRYQKGALEISTPSNSGWVRVNGRVSLDGMNLWISLDRGQVGPIFRFIGINGRKATLTGLITLRKKGTDGSLRVEGEDLEITETGLPWAERILFTFTTKGKRVDILKLELDPQGEGRISLFGRAMVEEPLSLDLRAELEEVEMGFGRITGWMEVKGRPKEMETGGSLMITHKGTTLLVKEIEGMVGIDKKGLVVKSLLARVGKAGRLTASGGISLGEEMRIDLSGLRWDELPWRGDYFRSWDGAIDLWARIRGGWQKPLVMVHLASSPNINGTKIDRFRAEITYKEKNVWLRAFPTPGIVAEGQIIPSTKRVNLKIRVNKERLSTLGSFLSLPLTRIDGVVNGEMVVEEDLLNPIIKGNLSIDPIETPNPVGMVKTKFLFRDGVLMADTFHIQQPSGHLHLTRCKISSLQDGEIEILGELVDFRILGIGLTGRVSFTARMEESFSRVLGELRSKDLMVNRKYSLKDFATMVLYTKGKGFELVPIQGHKSSLRGLLDTSREGIIGIDGIKVLQGSKEIFGVDGEVDMIGKTLNLEIAMKRGELGTLALYTRFVEEADGVANLLLRIEGPFDQPEINGTISLSAERMKVTYLEDEVRGLKADMVIKEGLVFVKSLKAKVGKSKIKIASKEGGRDFEIKTGGRPLRMDIPGFFRGGIRPSLRISRLEEGFGCKGIIELHNARFTYPPETHPLKKEELNWLKLDIRIIARSNVRYYNEYVDIELKDGSWISFKGRAENPCIGGVAWARPKKGRVIFLGTRFVVQEATLKFGEDYKPPFIFGTARATVAGNEVYLRHNGRLFEADPVLSIPGQPQLKEWEMVRLLRLGRDYRELTQEESRGLIRSGMLRLVGAEISSTLIYPLERRLGELLDLDVEIKTPFIEEVFSDTQRPKEEYSTDLEVNLGRYIAEDLYFGYHAKVLRGFWSSGDLRVDHGLGLELQFPEEESIQYEYRTNEGKNGEDHRVILRKELQF